MKIELEKASGKSKCRYDGCQNKSEYINEKGCIRENTTCAAVTIKVAKGSYTAYYCRDCIELLYVDLKVILNPKLWVFQ